MWNRPSGKDRFRLALLDHIGGGLGNPVAVPAGVSTGYERRDKHV